MELVDGKCMEGQVAREQQERSGSQIGLLSSLSPLITLFSAPSWGSLADRLRIHRHVLSLMLAAVVLWAIALSLITTFTWLIPAMLGYVFFSAPIQPLMDSGTMAMFRLYGAVTVLALALLIYGSAGKGEFVWRQS